LCGGSWQVPHASEPLWLYDASFHERLESWQTEHVSE
jgi:hypothetical protein